MSRIARIIVVWSGMTLVGYSCLLHADQPRDTSAGAPSVQPVVSHKVQSPAVRLLAQPASVVSPDTSSQRTVLDRYCVVCHNERLRRANLTLDTVDLDEVGTHAEVLEKVVRKLRSRAMPPARRPRPDETTYNSLATWLETELDRAAAANPNPGRPVIHRLNRTEYTNAIRDLLALEIDGPSLLATDESGYGFDNIADVLTFSPGLLNRYMSAAQKISRLAVGDPTIPSGGESYVLPRALLQEDRMSEDLPFGSRGGTVIRHHFPLDGEYLLRIRLRTGFNTGVIRGMARREELDVRLDGERIKLFTVGGECAGSSEPRCVRPREGATAIPSEYERTGNDGLEVSFPVKAGTRLVGVTFLKQFAMPEGAATRAPAALAVSTDDYEGLMEVETIDIVGPLVATGPGETPSRHKLFVCRPIDGQDEEPCARRIMTTLARRAYRRPVTGQDVEPLLGLYRTGQSEGGFEAGIQFALEGLLVSPHFLFRIERDPPNVAPGEPYDLSDLELASRLSFFLWSSIPDDKLLEEAARGKLNDPAILEQQVRRMLADARATTLVTVFADQWLFLRNMRMVAPDPRRFPEFDENLRQAFQRETKLFLEDQLREDRSVLDLLGADYTFVNERLARFYGIPNVYGSHFRRVTLNDDRRTGVLGQGSVLTVTSYPTRTSPTLRGKWVLDNILGTPPPPPPPDVETDLETSFKTGEPPTSVRARLEAHRTNAVCASCHVQMDPLGFALENYNAIGKWRTSEANSAIDSTGVLPDGTEFDGPTEFKELLLSQRKEEYIRTLTEKLLTYALGRGVEAYDMPAIRKIIQEATPADHRWSSLILGIVKSVPFQMKKAEDSASTDSTASQIR